MFIERALAARRVLCLPKMIRFLAMAVVALLLPRAWAATFAVGPGQPYAAIGGVPWESLQAGDTVLIHWRTNSYREKWVICRQGTFAAPIAVRGVPGPNGQLPVVDGNGATTRTALNYWNENRGVIKIGGANVPADTVPRNILVENLDIRSARPPFPYTGANGASGAYINNASAIYIEKGENITVRNCAMHDCGNGLFVASGPTLASSNILVEANYIYDNGNDASLFEHNNYTAAINIVFQYNRFGPLRAGCPGNNLKDRSAGLIVRYNWLEGGNRQLDLVDAEDSVLIKNHPRYGKTYVYGNVLIEPPGDGNRQIVHYGGDSGTIADYRKGTLHFFNNTLVSTRTDRTTLLRLSTDEEHADCRNNILYVTAAGNTLSIVDGSGFVNLTHNWLKPGWVNTFGTLTGAITNDSNLTGTSPRFLDEGANRYFLASTSACVNAGAAMHADVIASSNAPLRHYMPHQTSVPRPNYQAWDIGAYEFSALEAWRVQIFTTNAWNPSIGGNNADPNSNGVPNLLEYAFYRNPVVPGQSTKPFGFVLLTNSQSYFAIDFWRQIPPAAIRYTVQVSPDLNTWLDGSSFSDAGSNLTNSLTSTVSDATNRHTVVRLNQVLGSSSQRFLRVRVQE
jgi:hypothetical protein